MMEMTRRIALAAAFASIVALTSCADAAPTTGSGGSSSTAAPNGSAADGSSSSEGGGGRYGYGSGGSDPGSDQGTDDGATGPVARTVTVSNYSFTPATIRVGAGESIELKNVDPRTPHTFTVTGQSIDVSLDPGSSSVAKIDLDAGSYPFECRFHASQGMTGTLVVS
jgi:plastocyanin